MTTYSAIADSEIDPDSPITTSLMTKLRDNPLAIAEGDASAPNIEVKSFNNGAFRAFWTGNSTLSNGSVVPYSSESFDVNGWYNNGTYRYVPQKAGWYLITAFVSVGTGNTATDCKYYIRKNGAQLPGRATMYGTNLDADTLTQMVQMNGTTDYLDVVVVGSGTMTIAGGSSVWFGGCLIAPDS